MTAFRPQHFLDIIVIAEVTLGFTSCTVFFKLVVTY